MDKPKKKRPRDINELATAIVADATGEAPQEEPSTKNPAAVALGRLGGLKGGKKRANILTAERRTEIARLAAQTRWKSKTENE